MKKIIVKTFLFFLSFVASAYFCNFQTKGFRFQEILSDIPNNPRWEVDPLSKEQQKKVAQKLNQKFRYLGSGMQSHAFLGEDQKTVLKFFRHNDLSLLKMFNPSGKSWLWHLMTKYDPHGAFDSCKFAYEELRDQTGLHYLHLNKTKNQFNPVILVDKSGVAHTMDLDQTEFLVQDYCELVIGRIHAQMKASNFEAAKSTVKSLITTIEDWSRRGVHLENPGLKRNIGFFNGTIIMFDVGSLRKVAALTTPEEIRKEVKHATRSLQRWIYKHHPELYSCFERSVGFECDLSQERVKMNDLDGGIR